MLLREEARKRGDHAEWRKRHKEVFKAIRADQGDFIESKICCEMERARNDSKKVYSLVGELTQKSAARSDVIKDNYGTILTESDDNKERWVQYHSDFFKQMSLAETITTDQKETDLEPPPSDKQ